VKKGIIAPANCPSDWLARPTEGIEMVFVRITTNGPRSGKGGTNSMPLGGIVYAGKKAHRIESYIDRNDFLRGRPASNGWQEGQK